MNTAGHTTHLASWQVILYLVVGVILYGVYRFAKAFFTALRKEFFFVLAWRFLSGAHLHGERRTDAGWWTHGSDTKRHAFERGTFMDRWEHKPRGHRALWRLGIFSAVVATIYGLVTAWSVTVHAVESLVVYGLVAAGFVIETKIRLRVHNRQLIRPIAKSLANYLRISPHAARKMVHIEPQNIANDGDIGYFGPLPDHLTPGLDQQAGAARIIDVHLPVDSEMEWKLDQSPRIGVIRASQKPPDVVLWKDMLAEMARCAKGTVVLGKDKAKEAYKANLTDLDDPHWGFDVNTKYGKSNFLGIVTVQILHQDPQAQVMIIDPKRSSLIDFVGDVHDPLRPLLRGVTMANEPDDPMAMWAVVQKARAILDRRSRLYKQDRTRKFPCVLFILDELNQFDTLMKGMWSKLKFEDGRLPKDEREGLAGPWPGWNDIYDILQMGRFVNMHFLVCSQDFRDDIFGGRGGRNYFGLKGMAGFSPGQWDKFMQTKPVPLMQNQAGRWIFSDGSPVNDSWVQVTYADAEHDRAAYDYAAEGRDAFVDADGMDATERDQEQAALPSVTEEGAYSRYLRSIAPVTDIPQDDVTQGDQRRVICGLREAAHFLGMKDTTFRQARYRAQENDGIPGEFTKGRTPCWYEEDLIAWKASRPGKKRKPGLRLVKDDSTGA